MHRLLITKKGRSVFPCEYHCQSHLQTPQSVSVHIVLKLKMCGAVPVLLLYTFMAWTATPYLYHTPYVSSGEGFKIPIVVEVGFLGKKITLN